MSRHTRIHTNERRFNCSSCPKGFTRSDHLKKHEKTHRGHNNVDLDGSKVGKKHSSRLGRLKKKKLDLEQLSKSDPTSTYDQQASKEGSNVNEGGANDTNSSLQNLQTRYNFGSPVIPTLSVSDISTTGVVPRRGRPSKNKSIVPLKPPPTPLEQPEIPEKVSTNANVIFSQAVDNLINSVVADCNPFSTPNTPMHGSEFKGMEIASEGSSTCNRTIKAEEKENKDMLQNDLQLQQEELQNYPDQIVTALENDGSSPFNQSVMFPSPLIMYNQPPSQVLDYPQYVSQPFTKQDI